MDRAEALFVYETAGRLLAAEVNGFANVHGKSPDAAVRQGMVLHATDTALVLWRDVLGRVADGAGQVETPVPARQRPPPS